MCQIIKYAGMIMFCWLILATSQTTGQLHENYVGCFVDNGNDQKWEPVLKNRDDLTIEICIQKCYNETNQTESEMTFVALTNGRRCICRNNYGQQLRDTKCTVKCSGAPLQNCGGNQNNKLYSLYTVCSVGYFGPTCDQLCHCKRRLPCDRKTGTCLNGCEEQWTGTSCNTSNIEKQYIGCYGDGRQDAQAMDVKNPGEKTGPNERNTNYIEFCIEICSTNNYTYAGLQYGYDCHCGEKYDRYEDKTYDGIKVNCNYTCPAQRTQICGGRYANSVYRVCPVGFYGRNCTNRCRCTGNSCRFNGSCFTSTLRPCKPGWTGSACTTRDCRINNGDCESDEMCESVDLGFANLSMCRCKDGSYRDNNTCRPTSLHYVGCYKGSTTQYKSVELPTSDTLTIELCIQKCKQLNKKYSIIQDGVTCFCGDDYGQISPDYECHVPCTGNKRQYCGGKNTVYGFPIYVVYTAKSFLRQYIGCYNDNEARAMEKQFYWETFRNNTIESCVRHCGSNSYTYAGLQYSSECFCGNFYDRYGPLPESRCNKNCSGNNSQICGGFYANSVYAVNDILWCSSAKDCKSNEACNVIDLNYMTVSRCRCKQGFHRMSTWDLCTADVDECQTGTSSCNATSEYCINSIGSYRCECKDGFVYISGKCEGTSDVDECGIGSLVCHIDTELCKNTIGSYICHCKPGYENTTFDNCTDVDECQSGNSTCNPSSENCLNNIGSYRCECKDGFVNISGKCEDIDECGNGSRLCDTETELCKNTVGSYTCHCKPGYENTTSGTCTEINSTVTIGIILGTFLTMSLLICAILLIVSRINGTKSRKPESSKDMAQSDLEPSSIKISDQHEIHYDEVANRVDESNVYEQIILEQRQLVVNPTSGYEVLRLNDYVKVASSV